MKMCIKKSALLPVLIAALGCVRAPQIMAQTFTTLHNLTARSTNSSGYTNSDGLSLYQLIFSGNILYGPASSGAFLL